MQKVSFNLIKERQKRASDLSNVLEEALSFAITEGAEEATLAIGHQTGFSLDVRMGAVDTLSFNEDKSLSIAVYCQHKKGIAHTSDFSSLSIKRMVEHALTIAKYSAKDLAFGLPDRELITNEFPELDLFHPSGLSPEKAIELAIDAETYAKNQDERIINSDGVSIATHDFMEGFINSSGGKGFYQSSLHSMSIGLIAEDSQGMQRDGEDTVARNQQALLDIETLAKRAASNTVKRLNPRKIKTQKLPVLFSSRVSSSLLSAFTHAISGGNLYKKNSFLLDALGQTIFPKNINIYEAPHLKGALGSAPFDNDGVLTRNNVFVKDGILNQYVLGTYSARRLGLKTTANSGGVHNLTLTPTDGNLSALLKKMGKGLLVTELMGSGVNGLTGDYSRGATGFYVENGEILYPVEEITIAGNLKQMFANIIGAGNDFNPNIGTRAGSILIEEMMIAGA